MRQIADKISSPRAILLAGVLIIIGACFAAYIPAIKGGFVWDDDVYITDNPLLKANDGLYRIWLSTDSPSQYFPLAYTTFWFECRLWGFNPAGYHTVNVAIHIANALLLWLALRRLSIPGAWFASAVFALHPVQVESVAWITEQKNVLMLFFSLLSVLCWMESAIGNKSGRKANLFYAGSLGLFALALFSKSTACTLPAVLVLILWLKRMPLTVKRWMQIVPFVVMGIGMGLLVMWWEKNHQATGLVNLRLGAAGKLLIAGRALWFYLWKLFWPVNLTFSYPRWNIDPTAIRQYAWPAASALVLACAWVGRNRLGRGIVTAILFFLAILLPTLGFFSIYTFIYTFVADHYQYAACIGPITLVAAGGALVYRRSGKNVRFFMFSAGSILILSLGVLSWRQCHAYANVETLWLDTLKKNPDSVLAHGEIGRMLFKQGKFNEAQFHFEQKIKAASYMKTIFPFKYALFLDDYGVVLKSMGRLDEAIACYQNSLDVWEHFAGAHFTLGLALVQKGNVELARVHFLRALEITHDKKDAQLNQRLCPQLNLNLFNEEIHHKLYLLEEKK